MHKFASCYYILIVEVQSHSPIKTNWTLNSNVILNSYANFDGVDWKPNGVNKFETVDLHFAMHSKAIYHFTTLLSI